MHQKFYSHDMLLNINMSSISWAFNCLNIDVPIVFASDLNVDGEKSLLLSNLVKAVGADTYISGPSGKDYLDLSFFNEIDVEFFQPKVDNYYSCLYNILMDKI